MTFLCLYISRWWRQTWDTAPYFTVVNQSEARISTEHGITLVTPCLLIWIREFIHAPKAQHGIAMVSVDKFLYPRNHTRCNKFIPRSYDVCQTMKRFCSFKISDTPCIWLKSSYKHSVAWSHRSSKESGRWSWSLLWRHQWCSSLIIFCTDDVKREIHVYTSWFLANLKRESAPSMG